MPHANAYLPARNTWVSGLGEHLTNLKNISNTDLRLIEIVHREIFAQSSRLKIISVQQFHELHNGFYAVNIKNAVRCSMILRLIKRVSVNTCLVEFPSD